MYAPDPALFEILHLRSSRFSCPSAYGAQFFEKKNKMYRRKRDRRLRGYQGGGKIPKFN